MNYFVKINFPPFASKTQTANRVAVVISNNIASSKGLLRTSDDDLVNTSLNIRYHTRFFVKSFVKETIAFWNNRQFC